MIEFFDSYGKNDAELLEYSETSKYFTNGTPLITYLINDARKKHGCGYVYNNQQLQSADFEDIATCGRYAALRVRFHNISLDKFKSLVNDEKYGSDFIVTALTILFNEGIDEIITEEVKNLSKVKNTYKVQPFKRFPGLKISRR